MGDLKEIVKTLSNLTVQEVAALIKLLEEDWGVSASAAVVAAASTAGGETANGATEKTSFSVVLKSFDGAKKIAVLKAVKEIAGLGLSEAKSLVEGAPKEVKADVEKSVAEEIKKKLEEAGAIVELK